MERDIQDNVRPAGADAAARGRGFDAVAGEETGDDKGRARSILELTAEIKEYASHYLSATLDRYRLSLRSAGIYAAIGVLAFIAFSAMLATASVLLVVGAAVGLGSLFGGNLWLGAVVAGLAVLLCAAAGIHCGIRRFSNKIRKRTVQKYEQRQALQRTKFGRDVEEAAHH